MKYIKNILFTCSLLAFTLHVNGQTQIVLKEGAELAAKQAVKEATQAAAKKVTKEAAEAAAKKVAKEQTEKISILFIKESGEKLLEKATRILVKEGAETALEGTVKVASKEAIGKVSTHTVVSLANKEAIQNTTTKNTTRFIFNKGFKSQYLGKQLGKTAIQKELTDILSKGPVNLSPKEIKYLRENLDYANLKALIKKYTGDKKNFIEFFIRLSKNNPELTKEILNNPTIRKKINHSIRNSSGGGVHEWLMTKNFEDFLLNPKWGDDGSFLAIALVKFVQKTSSVAYKKGGDHFSGTLFSKQFHDGLSRIIEKCSSKEELFIAIKKYAKTTLTKESYDEFIQIFTSIFNANRFLV